ncbi:MAG: CDP-alcohol phosphatidyltransferase family protein [Oscillospiraceae bacterium]|jgi:CDP-diacylglycerol--serine O-phosphatidyltransferase|nr:CDP-alcohol phosphatidyltransferase family protein [Oscillospiraceae bacterium]
MIGYYDYTVVATYAGLTAAVIGILFALTGNPTVAVYCLMIAGCTDMFDGRIARTKKGRTESEKKFGIQIDSLTDLVCFGVLPASVLCSIWVSGSEKIPFAAMAVASIYVLCAMIRLAYFNVVEEERQAQTTECRKEFLGMPVTTVAILLPLVYAFRPLFGEKFPIVLTVAMAIIALAFVSKIRVRKPGSVGVIIMSIIGIAELVFLIVGGRIWG